MKQQKEAEKQRKVEEQEALRMLRYIEQLPAAQRITFMEEMELHDLEQATRIQGQLQIRRQRAAQRRAETRRRKREAAAQQALQEEEE